MMMVFIALLDENHAYKEVEEQLTMHDFSLEVLHPPTNNPDYYEAYFHALGGEVRIVSVILNNGKMIKLRKALFPAAKSESSRVWLNCSGIGFKTCH